MSLRCFYKLFEFSLGSGQYFGGSFDIQWISWFYRFSKELEVVKAYDFRSQEPNTTTDFEPLALGNSFTSNPSSRARLHGGIFSSRRAGVIL